MGRWGRLGVVVVLGMLVPAGVFLLEDHFGSLKNIAIFGRFVCGKIRRSAGESPRRRYSG